MEFLIKICRACLSFARYISVKLCVEDMHETSVSICELVKIAMTVSKDEVHETRRSERHSLLIGVK